MLCLVTGCDRHISSLPQAANGRGAMVFQTGSGESFVRITGLGTLLGSNSAVTSIVRNTDGTMWASLSRQDSGGFADSDLAKIGNSTAALEFNHYLTNPRVCQGSGQLAVTRDGSAWFSNSRVTSTANQLCKVSSSGGVTPFTIAALPTTTSITHLTAAPDGSVWFSYQNIAAPAGGQGIGRIASSGASAIYPISQRIAIASLVYGPDGNVWFAANPSASGALPAIGSVSPGGAIAMQTHSNMTFGDLVSSPDGNLYASVLLASPSRALAIAAITTAGALQTYPLSPAAACDAGCTPAHIALGPFGNVWLGRADGSIQAFSHTQHAFGPVLNTPLNGAPTALANGGDDNLWLAGGRDGSGLPIAGVYIVRDIAVHPLSLNFSATGQTQTVSISERYFNGTFTAASADPSIAAVTPGSTPGSFSVTLKAAGSTTITLSDRNDATKSNAVSIPVTCSCRGTAP